MIRRVISKELNYSGSLVGYKIDPITTNITSLSFVLRERSRAHETLVPLRFPRCCGRMGPDLLNST